MSRWPGNAQTERTTFGGLSRGQLMSRVRSTGNETTEKRLATLLRNARLTGWRRNQSLPGHPDFVWPKTKVAVFVDGCFWHGHDCGKNVSSKTNPKEWRDKIRNNQVRDRRVTNRLRREGWRVARVWECELAGHAGRCIARIQRMLRYAKAMTGC